MISTDFSLPSFIERAKTVTLSMAVYEDGPNPVAPVSGTFTLYNQSKVVVVTGAVTVTSSIATFQVTAAVIPTATLLSAEWQEEWVMTLADGRVETIRRDAYLCLRGLYNPVNEAMLLRRVSDLQNLKHSSLTSFQGYIDEAWSTVEGMLLQDGKRPYLIMNSWALKEITLCYSLQYIFQDVETYMSGEGRYAKRAKEYSEAASAAYATLKLEYDFSETNQRASADDSTAAISILYLNTPPRGYRGGDTIY
jgi:hypothetical protein